MRLAAIQPCKRTSAATGSGTGSQRKQLLQKLGQEATVHGRADRFNASVMPSPSTYGMRACSRRHGAIAETRNKGARETEVEGNEPLEISDYYITNIIFFTWAHKG
jgi:hypothetical protein